MKLVTFEVASPLGRVRRLGALSGHRILDLNFLYAWLLSDRGHGRPQIVADAILPSDMLHWLEGGEASREAAREVISRAESLEALPEGLNGERLSYSSDEVVLRCPLPRANSLRDFLAFEAHTKRGYERRGQEMPSLWYQLPVYYKGNPRSLIGPDEDVLWPSYTQKFDYELELACVIGKPGRNIPLDRASRHIAGYCVMNDFSARDVQMEEVTLRLGPAKGKDFATALGPYLVTPDEIDVRNLRMTARINGELWSDGNSGSSHWSFEQMIAYVSNEETLYPGDVLGSGTVGGGCGYEFDRWVNPGDLIELEIEGLGILRNRVRREADYVPITEAMHVSGVQR